MKRFMKKGFMPFFMFHLPGSGFMLFSETFIFDFHINKMKSKLLPSGNHILKKMLFVAAVALIFNRADAQVPVLDFYFGANTSVLNEIPEHFKQVNAGYQEKYSTSDEYALRRATVGFMWGLRLNFVSDNFSLPLSLEYNRVRKINRSNRADFPDIGYTGQYRMKYSANSIGFVFGKCEAPLRFSLHFDYGRIFWKKKYYPGDEFSDGKWVQYTETIDYGVFGVGKGPLFTGLNLSIIGRWKFLEARAYYFMGGKVKYPDYTNNVAYYLRPDNFGLSLCFVPTRTKKE